jgi:taurine dioxygenase
MSAVLETQAMQVRPLGARFGAEIIGLDLSRPLDEATRRAVFDAFIRYNVICFRDQKLDPDRQITFTDQFGTLERHTVRNRGTGNPLVHVVTNLGADGKPSGKVANQLWHSDKSFRELPSLATILHAVTLPPDGGDTCFANMQDAYDALDDAEKQELAGVGVVHSWELSLAKSGKQASAAEIADAPPMTHKLVRTIPETGRKGLFMGEHASHFAGRPMAEGRARLAALEEFATQERFLYRHKWRQGDVLMWDNRCLLHRADQNFDAAAHPRVLHRTCLRGSAPA